MRTAVVVIALAAACTKPVDQPPECAVYTHCLLDNDGAGYQTLAAAVQERPDDPELSCYAGFADAVERGDLDKIIDPMVRAYGGKGTCWAGGYSAVGSSTDLETRYVDACQEHCQIELAAECARSDINKACADDDDVKAFCADSANTDLIAAAVCPASEGEGEGE